LRVCNLSDRLLPEAAGCRGPREITKDPLTRRHLIPSLTGAAALTAVLGLLASACGGARGPSAPRGQPAPMPASPPTAQRAIQLPDPHRPAAGERLGVTVYYLRTIGDERYLAPEEHVVVAAPGPERLASAALTELLAGTPRYLGDEPPFPGGTRLLGLRLARGVATVDLSREALGAANSEGYALQALVWTATQVPAVKRVVVRVEGRSDRVIEGRPVAGPLGAGAGGRQLVRDQSLHMVPIVLEEPSPRSAVAGARLVARGAACVSGGTVGLRLRDGSGQVISQSFATMGTSAPSWGRFSGALQFTPPRSPELWQVEAFETSAADASVTYSVVVPVWVGRG
jgi:hypothetical protein